ncbi:NusG domain II-containing protein [Brucepastera parasyntrophica]|uniref:NusG domain II-containing protein n=1 Tax=Brucepastera parasyntrophica TaxID=2880008 RepID=UPI00210C085A|nr:NusG domain II-containing protein [Brucepastera parasyntrophica]ULQ59291.1 NusG domain II-containing protein [Brucepastera parasyntrophica]
MKNRKGITISDILILIAGLFVFVLSLSLLNSDTGGERRIVIESPEGTWLYGMEADRTISIPGKLGPSVIRISEDSAAIIYSPCPNQTCITAGAISKTGSWAACLPNRVMLKIEGGPEEETIDAMGY